MIYIGFYRLLLENKIILYLVSNDFFRWNFVIDDWHTSTLYINYTVLKKYTYSLILNKVVRYKQIALSLKFQALLVNDDKAMAHALWLNVFDGRDCDPRNLELLLAYTRKQVGYLISILKENMLFIYVFVFFDIMNYNFFHYVNPSKFSSQIKTVMISGEWIWPWTITCSYDLEPLMT